MPAESFEQLLDQAATLCGIGASYYDIWGRQHFTTVEAKQAILRALGMSVDSAEELKHSLAAIERLNWERLLPPVIVAEESADVEFPLSIAADCLGHRAHFTVRREDGGTSELDLNLWDLPQAGSIEMEGGTWVRIQVRLPLQLPLGYHEISVRVGAVTGATRYIVTPARAWTPPQLGRGARAAGIAVSLYGIRSGRNWGSGDFRDLMDLVDWVADDVGASFVALNPLHAIHNRRPFNTSPYLPNSTFYQNFLYLDVEGMEDYQQCRRAQQMRCSPEVVAEIEALRGTPFVEYERVSLLKLRFLQVLFVQFLRDWRKDSPRAREFREFREREGTLLEDFATYCALDDRMHTRDANVWLWTQWPEAFQNPRSAETRAFREKHWRRVMFYQYLQWQIDLQLSQAQQRARSRSLSIGLYHDLALATDRFGSDLWAHHPFYVAGCRVGSPPDDFSPSGQDWAFPPPNAGRHREDGYRLFVESIRKNCRHGGALRIDHVMRLFRLYWIPDGSDAAHGAYVREKNEDLVRILALESVRNRVLIVGEDLGTVEPSVRETLARLGILSYRLLYFEKSAKGEFRRNDEYPPQALVSSTTHDLPTLAGFWVGADIEARRSTGLIDEASYAAQLESRAQEKQKMLSVLFERGCVKPELSRRASDYPELTGDLHHAVIGFLAQTPSQLLAINHEDLTKELHQQNLPGSTWQYPNWSRKMRFTVEELRRNPEARGYTAMVADWVAKSGRKNQAGE